MRTTTYADLDAEVCRLAGALKSRKVAAGQVVAIYMPMIPEAAAAFLAIAKIGAVAMPLFSGFGPQPIAERLIDADARAVITVDVALRRGKSFAMKENAFVEKRRPDFNKFRMRNKKIVEEYLAGLDMEAEDHRKSAR